MSSYSSSVYFDEDFAEESSSKLPRKGQLGKMKGQNSRILFPSEGQDDSGSETDSESDGDEDTDGSDESEQDHQEDYNEMSMEELLKLQEDIGTKKFKQKVLGESGDPSSKTEEEIGGARKLKKKHLKRVNKNRPSEVRMMHKTAPRMFSLDPRQKIKKKVTRDPRFDDLSGNLNMKIWKGNYNFLKDKRKEEKEILKKELNVEQDRFKKQKISSIIQRMENQEREQAKQDKEMEIRKLEKQQQMESLRQGKKPKFTTKQERKLLLKAAHFEELKKENRVDKYLQRKEKRKLAKERRDQRDT